MGSGCGGLVLGLVVEGGLDAEIILSVSCSWPPDGLGVDAD